MFVILILLLILLQYMHVYTVHFMFIYGIQLPETCKKEWREVKEECRQAADRQNEVLTAMSEKYEKHMQLVSATGVYI